MFMRWVSGCQVLLYFTKSIYLGTMIYDPNLFPVPGSCQGSYMKPNETLVPPYKLTPKLPVLDIPKHAKLYD